MDKSKSKSVDFIKFEPQNSKIKYKQIACILSVESNFPQLNSNDIEKELYGIYSRQMFVGCSLKIEHSQNNK